MLFFFPPEVDADRIEIASYVRNARAETNTADRSEQFCSDSARSGRVCSAILLASNRRNAPMRINWEVVKPCLWTGAGGVVVGMLLLSNGFGFMSRTTAEKLAAASSEKAVIAVLAPVCADKFRALADVAARTAILV